MEKLKDLKPARVFYYFEALSAIPRGSGNQKAVSDFCVHTAEKLGLSYVRDRANNVIIYKQAASGYEAAPTVILQGHLDMVCQKEENCAIDFETDGLTLTTDGDFIQAKGTTLGADNGIAVAMILAILEDKELQHPALEAVFTTDEEIGMLGALQLDFSLLKGKTMLNIDSEDPKVLTVSCAGGSDFTMRLPYTRTETEGTRIAIQIGGLQGGHSGVEINSGRINANRLMGRLLRHVQKTADFEIIQIAGGEKGNAIPAACRAELCAKNPQQVTAALTAYATVVRQELAEREQKLTVDITMQESGVFFVLDEQTKQKLLFTLLCAPNGVQAMSAAIDGLVETSLNLGVLKTNAADIEFLFTLRSNKKSAMQFLEEQLYALAESVSATVATGGYYPPWEYKENSRLQSVCKAAFLSVFGQEPQVEAIHAGLECGVFADAVSGLDCVSIGPLMYDIHTTRERLSISSTAQMYAVIKQILQAYK